MYDRFDADRDEVLKRNSEVIIIENGTTVENNRQVLTLAEKYPNVKVALGLYPGTIIDMSDEDIEAELAFIKEQDIVAVGEVGLDGTYPDMDKQIIWFKRFVKLAAEKNVPIIIHSRKAEKEVIDLLEEMDAKKVILHCFNGKLKLADRAEKLGFYFSISTTIGHSQHFRELVKRISLSQLFTETDAPFLSPKGYDRNEPQYVIKTVEKIAEIKGMDVKEVENVLFMNYQRLFSQ